MTDSRDGLRARSPRRTLTWQRPSIGFYAGRMTILEAPARRGGRALTAAVTIGLFVALLWVAELVDQVVLRGSLDGSGIRPRTLDGLWGIVWAPLLHGGWAHLIANTGPLLVLGFTILLSGVGPFVRGTAIIWIVSGLGTWLLGAPGSVHVGASGLVFGWLVYLILRGLFTRRFSQILIGIAVLLVYGGVLWGVFPSSPNISWQGHLFGAIGGAIAAVVTGRRSSEPDAARRIP